MLDFISNLYKKNNHPLARESGVTQIIEELPADNPAVALEELTHWLLALSNAEGIQLKERVKRLARIDQSAQKYERALRRQYTDASRMHKTTEERIWNASFDFLEATVNAHLRCIANLPQKGEQSDRDLAIVIMRALRRLDLQAHWLHLRYRPIPLALWERIFTVIQLAEERALLHLPITLNSTAQAQTTIAQEMLKMLMMSVAAPEHLTKTQIDLAHLLTHNLAGTFSWEQIPNGSTVFHVDFSKPGIPVRLTKVSEHHFMSRCFGSGEAVRELVVGLKQLESGGVPTTLGAIDFSSYKREDLLEVMAHLSQCWCKMDVLNQRQHFDKRHAKRTQVFFRISVVHSFNLLYEQLAQPVLPAPTLAPKQPAARNENIAYQEQVDMKIYGFITEKTRDKIRHMQAMQALTPTSALALNNDEDETESWVVENISQMGYGVTISSLKEDWLQSNTVIGIQPDTAPWQIGVIRRVASESVENTQTGIQILSNQPHAAMLRPIDKEMSVWETAADTQTYHHTPALYMHKEPPYQDGESLLLASGSYQLHRTYAMVVGEETRTIRLLDRINTFQGVDQIIFTDVKSKNNR
ncbi:MAG: hypothetical protein IV108_09545 [Burkholderiales bacterium]|nr:hypothetical protein [Burkholderiales bacterium]